MAKKTDLVLFDALLGAVLEERGLEGRAGQWHQHIRRQVQQLVAAGASPVKLRRDLDSLLELAVG